MSDPRSRYAGVAEALIKEQHAAVLTLIASVVPNDMRAESLRRVAELLRALANELVADATAMEKQQ